jgi:hypothetical protein
VVAFAVDLAAPKVQLEFHDDGELLLAELDRAVDLLLGRSIGLEIVQRHGNTDPVLPFGCDEQVRPLQPIDTRTAMNGQLPMPLRITSAARMDRERRSSTPSDEQLIRARGRCLSRGCNITTSELQATSALRWHGGCSLLPSDVSMLQGCGGSEPPHP